MIVAGIMSGTSADGVDVALCRITAGPGTPKIKLLAHAAYPYPRPIRTAVLAAMDAQSTSTAELSRLHWRLGALYSVCLQKTSAKFSLTPTLAGLHGQTIYHQATPAKYLGAPTRATWQIGEPGVLAERLRIPIVSDFRPADLAAGGQAAPLVPMLDLTLFAHKTRNRILQNLGGIANLTAIPAASVPPVNDILAFDTGPANMVLDALMTRLFRKPYDRNGATARRGTILQPVLTQFLKDPYFAALPPKSCGREQYGEAFTTRFLAACRKQSPRPEDAVATATALTAESILEAYRRHVWPHLGQRAPLASHTDFLVSGGGSRNATLMNHLREGLTPLGVIVRLTDDLGLPSQAKEAAAFALLAWLTWHQLPGNLPAATGAARHVILGRITYA